MAAGSLKCQAFRIVFDDLFQVLVIGQQEHRFSQLREVHRPENSGGGFAGACAALDKQGTLPVGIDDEPLIVRGLQESVDGGVEEFSVHGVR